jgi:hypothetical protein
MGTQTLSLCKYILLYRTRHAVHQCAFTREWAPLTGQRACTLQRKHVSLAVRGNGYKQRRRGADKLLKVRFPRYISVLGYCRYGSSGPNGISMYLPRSFDMTTCGLG